MRFQTIRDDGCNLNGLCNKITYVVATTTSIYTNLNTNTNEGVATQHRMGSGHAHDV